MQSHCVLCLESEMFRLFTICVVFVFIEQTYGSLSDLPIPDDIVETATDLRDACFKKLGLTMDDRNKMDWDGNRSTKCYMSCLMEEANWMDPTTGEIMYDAIDDHKIKADKDKLEVYKENCPHQPEGDNCEKAYTAISCYRSHHMDTFWFP